MADTILDIERVYYELCDQGYGALNQTVHRFSPDEDLARNINAHGRIAQIAFLLGKGLTPDQITRALLDWDKEILANWGKA